MLAGVALVATFATATGTAATGGGWGSFGGSVENTRHSPLTTITTDNVAGLQLAWKVDLAKLDPTIKLGQQSYPVVVNGVLYATTASDGIYALDAATGAVRWHWQPVNRGIFKNFGVVANRGVTYCNGRVFMATLDMRLVSLDAGTGKVLRNVPIADAVPGATAQQGYSETSPPLCYGNTLLVGAAGSDYGVRSFFMGYHANDLTPAWPHPYWIVPPELQGWRAKSRLVGGGSNWTPSTVDPTTGTVYFDTGPPAPLYFPQLRPGNNPRTDSLIALDVRTGKQRWWQQQLANDQWGYDTAQPPMVYDAKIGGKTQRLVSVASKEGVWFAYDARSGRPVYQRIKVIDQIEHPALRPGQPVTIYPASLGGINYSPATFDPATGYVVNAASEIASTLVQSVLTPAQQRRTLAKGDVFLGLDNGNFGSAVPNFKDHGSISAIDVATGTRVWKFDTPQPERGGVTSTAGGVSFAGGGDGVVRAFATKTGKVLWTTPTGKPIAAGASVYAAGGKEYVAITVGGTPTSSNGGTASQVWAFTLGGEKGAAAAASGPTAVGASTPPSSRAPAVPAARRATFALPVLTVRPWRDDAPNYDRVKGTLKLRGAPVAGARISVGGYELPRATAADGSFSAEVDMTLAKRSPVSVTDASRARAGGKALSAADRNAVRAAVGGIDVGYRVSGLAAKRDGGGIAVEGKIGFADGSVAPTVQLYSYRLTGRVVGPDGKPVEGAIVTTRTADRDYWTLSDPTDAQGRYTSLFTASVSANTDTRVPFAVGVALGKTSYAFPFNVSVVFARLHSATMNLTLGPPGVPLKDVPKPVTVKGATYQGPLVGVVVDGRPVKPLSATWPDRNGHFRIVLPRSLAGRTVSLFLDTRPRFSRAVASPGHLVDGDVWATTLLPQMPRRLGSVRLP